MTVTAKEILAGDVRAAARLMRDLDDEIPAAVRVLKSLYRHTGRSYILGVTGRRAPGSPPSSTGSPPSCENGGRRWGSSPSIRRVPTREGPSSGPDPDAAARARRGGLHPEPRHPRAPWGPVPFHTRHRQRHGRDGKDVILIETVGVGQDEVEIVKVAHTNIVVVVPGLGTTSRRSRRGSSRSPTSSSSTRPTGRGRTRPGGRSRR